MLLATTGHEDKQLEQQLHEDSQPAQSVANPALQQECMQLLLELDSNTAPAETVKLVAKRMPYLEVLHMWQEHQHNSAVCNARLIGDTQKPDEYVGIATSDLIAHSAWAAARLRQTDMLTGGMETVLPVRTSPAVVRKLVESLYTGTVKLQEDVEQILVLANCMQVLPTMLAQADCA